MQIFLVIFNRIFFKFNIKLKTLIKCLKFGFIFNSYLKISSTLNLQLKNFHT